GDYACVESNDECRASAGRHERACAIHVDDGLRHRLTDVGIRMEEELDEPDVLDGLGFHVLNAVDIHEVILVIVHEVPLHLTRVHPAIRLSDVDHGCSQIGEYVHAHALQSNNGRQSHSDDHHQDRDRTPHRHLY